MLGFGSFIRFAVQGYGRQLQLQVYSGVAPGPGRRYAHGGRQYSGRKHL